MTRLGWFSLAACCIACSGDPLRPPLLTRGWGCDAGVFIDSTGAATGDTLFRYWYRGSWHFDTWPKPRLLEVVYDPLGRPLILASITEKRTPSGTTGVEVLAVRFESERVPVAVRVLFGPDQAQKYGHREERAFRRFHGPAYLPRIVSPESATPGPIRSITKPIRARDAAKARALAAELWKIRCSEKAPARGGER